MYVCIFSMWRSFGVVVMERVWLIKFWVNRSEMSERKREKGTEQKEVWDPYSYGSSNKDD